MDLKRDSQASIVYQFHSIYKLLLVKRLGANALIGGELTDILQAPPSLMLLPMSMPVEELAGAEVVEVIIIPFILDIVAQ